MIDAVLFDLYETLITEAPVAPTRASSLFAVLGLERTAYRTLWQARRPRIVVGELSFAQALTEISQTLAGTVDVVGIQRLCQQRVREKADACARPDDQIMALITELVRRNVRLGVISNGFKEDVIPWPSCALAPAFRCTAFSCDEGVAKPDPEIYLRALHRVGVKPEAALYVGDGGDDELAGAEAIGIRAVRAAWFAAPAAHALPWPELRRCDEVLSLIPAG
jgi:HAD superfamily hydrolase (TIGR01509 family)